jgi:hypothetical protein
MLKVLYSVAHRTLINLQLRAAIALDGRSSIVQYGEKRKLPPGAALDPCQNALGVGRKPVVHQRLYRRIEILGEAEARGRFIELGATWESRGSG